MARKVLHGHNYLTQTQRVYDYLKSVGKSGATNMEMMMALYITDVRKCISDLNWGMARQDDKAIASKFETGSKGAIYKRYYLVPSKYENNLEEWLYGPKCTAKSAAKPRHTRRR